LERLQRLKRERRIIDNALKTLPKTLDETYERILMEIPKDEWPFTRHALRWICFHQDAHQDQYAMSTQILLAATELDACREVCGEIELEYNTERLRNMLGCLVHVEKDSLISLAHYTVQEYLESNRTSQSAVSYFWIEHGSMMKECMRTILQEAQTFDWPEAKDIPGTDRQLSATPDEILVDFVVYCVVSGSTMLVNQGNVLGSDEQLLRLAIDFINHYSRHYDFIDKIPWMSSSTLVELW
jgi:hypothetical protein